MGFQGHCVVGVRRNVVAEAMVDGWGEVWPLA